MKENKESINLLNEKIKNNEKYLEIKKDDINNLYDLIMKE